MCSNECMPFKKFYSLDSNNDLEVSFLLELTSILQIEFNENIILYIQSGRSLQHLIDAFNWTRKPIVGPREVESDECWLDLTNELNLQVTKHIEEGREAIISSGVNLSGHRVKKIPGHLLSAPLKIPAVTTSLAWSVAKTIKEENFYTSEPHKVITVVSTNEVNEWISLIEATAAIIAYWYRYQNANTRVELLDLSQGIQKAQANKVAVNSDHLIIAKISPTTSQFIKFARAINPECQIIIHGFESSSVYFANTFLYGLDDILYEEDLWIMSCKSDDELAKKAWQKINTAIVPLKELNLHQPELKKLTERKDILFFGRISEQKNISASLMAVAVVAERMRHEKRKFKIFGYEDYLGVPNLKIPSQGYLEDLYSLVKKLHIDDLVEFHHAVQVEQMEEILSGGIFLSPSVHSDENFGLVAFRALRMGTPVILSKWGGHIDLGSYFSGIRYVDVFETSSGAEVNPYEIAKNLLKVWDKNPVIHEQKKAFQLLPLGGKGLNKLLQTQNRSIVIDRIVDAHPWTFRKWPLYGKIFKGHKDPNNLLAQRSYGAQSQKKFAPHEGALSSLVSVNETEIKVKDSRLGVLRKQRKNEAKKVELKQLGTDKIYYVSFPEWNWLWENGYIYPKGEL